ncbi:hypothetical protein FHX12_005710 [Rhizobium sp. BK609]|nr:hypothetical protein [Rhizobium sp. BK098]MBB3618688.1 hypothetical protein [Rhizobium sp. BK609]MBB3684396.1 hypothetical protein [Rhizobium sp. BK612]
MHLPLHRGSRHFRGPAGVLELAVALPAGKGAAAGLAAINSVGNLGGFIV